MKAQHQLLIASFSAAGALALGAFVGAHGGPHVVGAVIGLTLRHHVLQALAGWLTR